MGGCRFWPCGPEIRGEEEVYRISGISVFPAAVTFVPLAFSFTCPSRLALSHPLSLALGLHRLTIPHSHSFDHVILTRCLTHPLRDEYEVLTTDSVVSV